MHILEKYINKNDNSLMMKLVKKYIQQIINIFLISVVTVIINIFITSIFGLAIDQIIPNIKTISFFLIRSVHWFAEHCVSVKMKLLYSRFF